MRSISRTLLATLMIVGAGCASSASQSSNSKTRLELRSGSRMTSVYEFREVLWRVRDAGVEMIGYGQLPFDNSSLSRSYDPKWPPRGFVTFRIRVEPDSSNQYQLMILGPSGAIGPGDSEVLTGTPQKLDVQLDGDVRRITFADMPIRSRNRPDVPFTLSGTIIATAGSESAFERQLREFETELSHRGPAPANPPRSGYP